MGCLAHHKQPESQRCVDLILEQWLWTIGKNDFHDTARSARSSDPSDKTPIASSDLLKRRSFYVFWAKLSEGFFRGTIALRLGSKALDYVRACT